MLRFANGLRPLLFTACLGAASLVACSKSVPEASPPPPPSSMSFAPVEGAEHYRVRAWSDLRLLFEISVRDTQFAVTPALRRALQPFDDVELEITAYDEGGAVIRTLRRAPRSQAESG